MSQVAAKNKLVLRDERVKILAHFRESGSVLAGTALDRLTHHTHTLIIRGQSYRQRSQG